MLTLLTFAVIIVIVVVSYGVLGRIHTDGSVGKSVGDAMNLFAAGKV